MRHFDLPYPPSVNHYWRRVGARTLISRTGRAFRKCVCEVVPEGKSSVTIQQAEVDAGPC